ncbi:MAG: hypothetical protein ABIN68_00735 [Sphingomicrobium sp.]
MFRLLTLIALIAAPLAAPAAAMAPAQNPAADCKMDMGGSQHQMPASHHRTGEPCCVAVPAAIGPSLAALEVAPAIDHPTFAAVAVPFRLGAGPKAEDPPPRLA